MLFTKKSEYALIAIGIIAKSKKLKTSQDISQELQIQKPFLSKILQSLVLGKILISKKGVNGGFLLARDVKDITMLDIVNCVEDANVSVFTCSSSIDDCPRSVGRTCTIWKSLNLLQKHIEAFLNSISILDILNTDYKIAINTLKQQLNK